MVEAACGESYQCKFDYSTTLSREFAVFTKYYQDQFVNIREGVLRPAARGDLVSPTKAPPTSFLRREPVQ